MNRFTNEQSVSFKAGKRVIQHYDLENCCPRKRKTIKYTSQRIKSLYLRNFNEIQILTTQGIQRQCPQFQFQVLQQYSEIIIHSPFFQTISLTQTLRNKLNMGKWPQMRLYSLGIDLLQKLIDQGNLAFLPTSDNIYIEGDSTMLNLSSVVGTAFLETRQAVSKAQFKEICPLLYEKALGSQSLEIDYMSFKQRAVLIFMLTLLCNRELCFVPYEKIEETVTFQDAKCLINIQKGILERYLMSKSVMGGIKRFENTTNLRWSNVIYKVLINEQRLSWPQFINELTRHRQSQETIDTLERDLSYLAQHHWQRLPYYTKKKMYKDGWLSIRQNQPILQCDKNFFLAKMMKIPLHLLLYRPSLAKILKQATNFDKIGYEVWNNFLKILPQTRIQRPKQKSVLSQSHHYQLIRGQLQANCKQSHTEDKQNQQEEDIGLFSDDGSIDFGFIMRLGQRKLTNNITLSSKQVTIRHEKLKSLDQINQAFR